MNVITRAVRGRTYLPGLARHAVRHPTDLRHLPEWARLLQPSPVDSRVPWLPFSVIDHMSDILGPESRVFEFGGGGSTLWFADRGATVTTVEHDPKWHALIAASAPSSCEIRTAADPDAYVAAIDVEPDASFDVILVDGEERVRCVEHAISKVRPGGRLILDDSDRSEYAPALPLLRLWPRREFSGLAPGKAVPGHTVWQRPPCR